MLQSDDSDAERDIADIQARADAVRSAIDRIRGTATNGVVTATVDARGRLESLQLSPRASKLPPTELAAEIVACTKDAIVDAEAAAREASRPLTDDPRFRQAAQAMKEFGSQVDSQPRRMDDEAYFESFNEDPLGRRT